MTVRLRDDIEKDGNGEDFMKDRKWRRFYLDKLIET